MKTSEFHCGSFWLEAAIFRPMKILRCQQHPVQCRWFKRTIGSANEMFQLVRLQSHFEPVLD
jgi:hypothetical protein